jgi:hypothetical protein
LFLGLYRWANGYSASNYINNVVPKGIFSGLQNFHDEQKIFFSNIFDDNSYCRKDENLDKMYINVVKSVRDEIYKEIEDKDLFENENEEGFEGEEVNIVDEEDGDEDEDGDDDESDEEDEDDELIIKEKKLNFKKEKKKNKDGKIENEKMPEIINKRNEYFTNILKNMNKFINYKNYIEGCTKHEKPLRKRNAGVNFYNVVNKNRFFCMIYVIFFVYF